MKLQVISRLPNLSSELGPDSKLCSQTYDSVAIVLRGISVDAHNNENDSFTASEAIKLALKLVKSGELRGRIHADSLQLEVNEQVLASSRSASSSGCLFLLLIPSFAGISAIYLLVDILA